MLRRHTLVEPIRDLVGGLVRLIAKGLTKFARYAYRKALKLDPPVSKLDHRLVGRKKTTLNEQALGVDLKSKKDLLLEDIDTSKHTFIVGASGFGKTNLISILQEHNLKTGKPIIFFDPKGDLEAMTTFKALCEENGRTCYVFSEHYEESVSLNPLLEGSVNQVADRIMRAFEWSEQYYKDMSYRALIKTLKDLQREGTPFSLQSIHQLLTKKYESDEITGLIVKIESILESDFGRFLNGTSEDMTFSKIREEGACLYIGLSTQGYGEMAMSIGKLFLEELLYNSYKTLTCSKLSKEAKGNPISVYFDEFGALVTPQFIELENKCRGAGIELTMAVQLASDIDRVDSSLTKQIIENASNLFVMKQRLDDQASLFSDAIGTIVTEKVTYQTDSGDHTGAGTVRESNELIAHPDIIKSLKVGQCILLRHNPMKVNLVNIRYRDFSKLLAKADDGIGMTEINCVL